MDKRIGNLSRNQQFQGPVRAEFIEAYGAYPSTQPSPKATAGTAGRTARVIFLLLLCCAHALNAAVTLRMTDQQGNKLEQVAAGQPFTVEVIITDLGSSSKAPDIRGDSRIALQSAGQQFTSINGKTTAKYLYQARINDPGVYALGPATLVIGGQSFDSNVLNVTVGTTQKVIGKQSKKESEEVIFALTANKKYLFVGESLDATLTFYYTDEALALKNILPPTLEGFDVRGDMNQYTQGQETIKGTPYQYVRWQLQLYPTKSGILTVPAYGAEYEKVATHNNRFGFDIFFLGRNERMRIYSNALSVQADPLPPYAGQVTAIGAFKRVSATIEPSVAQAGDAVVLAIEFEGDGNLDAIKTPELQGMPDALKYYDSKHYILPSDGKKKVLTKRFEYVVQGLRAGTWEIPAQEYVIFDVKKEAYRTFKTKPLTITITPSSVMHNAPKTSESTTQVDNQQTTHALALDETGLWYHVPQRAPIPWWLFLLLSFLPGVYLIAQCIWSVAKKRAAKHEPEQRAKKAFVHARVALAQAKKADDVAQVYPIFIQLFADRCRVHPKDVTQEFIEAQLQRAGLSGIDRTQWQEFFMRVTEVTYGLKTADKHGLFAQAEQWINALEGVL